MMGAGGGNGFSIRPDFKRYVVLFFFENEELLGQFLIENATLNWYLSASEHYLVAKLNPYKGHGAWGGEAPFDYDSSVLKESDPVAVITRATINFRALPDFWRNVPKVADFMHSAPALHQIGIGEYPLFMQATFSIWENLSSLKKTAYSNTPHAEVVKKTRERNWYKEELFAEFAIGGLSLKGEKFKRLKLLSIPLLENRDLPS